MKKINIICEKYNVNLIFDDIDTIAYYDDNIKTIILNKKNKFKLIELIPIIFHELGHKYCFENNLFVAYHYETDKRLFKLTALKAERFVDRWAANEMKKNGFDFEYPMYYYNKNRVKYFKELIENMPLY